MSKWGGRAKKDDGKKADSMRVFTAGQLDGGLAAKSEGEYKQNPEHLRGSEDMSRLIYLDERNILDCLGYRYNKDQIYTSISQVLVAINPYQWLPVYGKDQAEQFTTLHEKKNKASSLPPHVFGVSESAYHALLTTGKNQSLIVCGESGSGKTESAKQLMRYLAYTTTKDSGSLGTSHNARRASTGGSVSIEQQVLDANPVLEAFGNAKTNLNNNSSRFGKFTKILFDKNESGDGLRIVGSYIETYLLEQSRIGGEFSGTERNYHILYQICSDGLDAGLRSKLKLTSPKDFKYTCKSALTVQGIDDSADISVMQYAMTGLKVSKVDQESMFAVLAAVLHLGNVQFVENPDATVSLSAESKDTVRLIADILGLTYADVEKRLTMRTITVMLKNIEKPLEMESAHANRDAIAKALYSKLFLWIVDRINVTLFENNSNAKKDDLSWVGILDVFGFECFEHNSFEQFCINFANERLQEFFNTYIIASEQELYKSEAILWDPISIPSNQDTIDLIDGRPQGVMALLDSACVMPKGTPEIFTETLFTTHPDHVRLTQVKQIRYDSGSSKASGRKGSQVHRINGFAVSHYAGTVIYNAEHFLVKNAGATHIDTVRLFARAESPVCKTLFAAEAKVAETNKKKANRFVSTSSVFASQLRELLDVLRSTRPFFVRCIKPNVEQVKSVFTESYVRPQLRCGGLIEALRILKCGFPTRCPYDVIYERFGKVLQPQPENVNKRDFTEGIFVLLAHPRGLTLADYQMGLRMVFFRPGKQQYLEEIISSPAGVPADKIDKLKRYLTYKRLLRLRGAVTAAAATQRRLNRMRALKRFQSAASTLVIYTKTLRARLRRLRQSRAAMVIQACIRAAEARECASRGMAYGALFDLTKNPLYDAAAQILQWVRDVTKEALPGEHLLPELDTGVTLCNLLQKLDKSLDGKIKVEKEATTGSYKARDNVAAFTMNLRDLGISKDKIFDTQDLVRHHDRGDKALKSVVITMLETARKFYVKGGLCPQMLRDEIENGVALPEFKTTAELLAARTDMMKIIKERRAAEKARLAEEQRIKEEKIRQQKEEEERKRREEEERIRREKEEEERKRREEEERIERERLAEIARKEAEEAERLRLIEEERRRVEEEKRRIAEEKERKRREEEERRKREAEERERKRQEEEERRKREAEERERKRKEAEEERARKRAEEEERRRQEEEERQRRREEERLRREEEERRRKEEREEAERIRREEEEERLREIEEARLRREEDRRRRQEEEERILQEEAERRAREEEERREREEERRRRREEAERRRQEETEELKRIAEEEERKREEAAADRKRLQAEKKRKLKESKTHFTEGFACMRNADTDGAIECFNRAIAINPKYTTAFATRGLAYWMKGDFESAIEDCNEAIMLDPKYAQPYTTRGLSFREQGDLDKAIENYDKAIELDPNSPEAYNNRALVLREQKNYEGAIADCDKAVALMPVYAAAYNNRGISYWEMDNVDKAIEDFLKALELNKGDAKAANSLGLAYWKRDEVEEARKYYNLAISIDPFYAEPYSNRAVLQQSNKEYEQAIGSYEEAARCFVRRRDKESAAKAMETADELKDLLASLG